MHEDKDCAFGSSLFIFFYFYHALVNFGLLKSLELTNDHLEFEKLEKNFDLGATICHMMQQ
jgi:hypothetical protein